MKSCGGGGRGGRPLSTVVDAYFGSAAWGIRLTNEIRWTAYLHPDGSSGAAPSGDISCGAAYMRCAMNQSTSMVRLFVPDPHARVHCLGHGIEHSPCGCRGYHRRSLSHRCLARPGKHGRCVSCDPSWNEPDMRAETRAFAPRRAS